MRDRKATKSKVAATMAAIFALFASLVVFAPPAAAECGSVWSCNTWPYTAPPLQSGWVRDARIVDVNGRQETRTMDYRPPTCDIGVGLYVHKDVPVASTYFISVTPTKGSQESQVLPDVPATMQVDIPKDGRTYQWYVQVIPYDYTWSSYVRYPMDPLGWYHSGIITCGSAATPQPVPSSASPNDGSSAAGAQATCRAQGKVAKHVKRQLKPKRWACVALPKVCKKKPVQRRCNTVLRRWLR